MSTAFFNGSKYAWHDGLMALELSGRELRVLGIIASAHRDGHARLSVPDLVRRTKIPRRTVQRTLDAVERKGLVMIERSRGGPTPHTFTLLDPAGATIDGNDGGPSNCATLDGAVEEQENCAIQCGAVQGGDDCATLRGAVAESPNCATHDGAVTAPIHARARISTLTLCPPGGPSRGDGPVPEQGAELFDLGAAGDVDLHQPSTTYATCLKKVQAELLDIARRDRFPALRRFAESDLRAEIYAGREIYPLPSTWRFQNDGRDPALPREIVL